MRTSQYYSTPLRNRMYPDFLFPHDQVNSLTSASLVPQCCHLQRIQIENSENGSPARGKSESFQDSRPRFPIAKFQHRHTVPFYFFRSNPH
ncbi:hypothetical protein AVEN_247555-1 [Araneus ventricosus]|uniref:Uncharacterized protein n=1 Tax=Araneus ventricosus TaxID=182803 RepID=A0A4Y2D9T2_ARAVE|nr:hypothetical protein AVEN_247555-1 [Araneus ventricosus]